MFKVYSKGMFSDDRLGVLDRSMIAGCFDVE